ncbi:MAG: BatA domain-containing protein [Planctomycetota bacterium]
MPPFLHMPLAWSAFAVASIPIIIHLLNRRRLRRIDWAAMEFLLAALKKNKRRVRIEQLILLLCRIALMVLLALFLARPLLNDAGLGFLSGVLHSEEKVFVLDDSMSMEQRHTDTTLFGRARSALVDSLRRVVERSKRDVVSIIQTSRPESPRLQGGSLDRERVGAIEQDLETLSVTSTRAELARVIENLAEQSARAAGDAAARPRAISILTDLRASDWTDGGQDANAALLKAFERLVENEERPTRVILLDVGAEETSNVSVVSADITGGRPTLGIPADIQIGVTNHGSTPVSNLRVQLSYVDVASNKAPSMAIAPTITTLAAGETATVSLLCTFQSAGQYRATAEVSGSSDPLPADNKLSFVFDVVEATEILMVNGEPSSEAFEGETDFIASALRPSGEASMACSDNQVFE